MCQLDLVSLQSIVFIVYIVSNLIYIFVDYFSIAIFGIFKYPAIEVDILNFIKLFYGYK